MVDLDKKSSFDQAKLNSEAEDSYLTLCLLIQEEAVDDPKERTFLLKKNSNLTYASIKLTPDYRSYFAGTTGLNLTPNACLQYMYVS